MNHSISAANTFRRCNRLFFYKYVQGWESILKAPWLEFGSHIDLLLEVMDTSNLENAVQASIALFPNPYDQLDVELILRLWQKQYGSDPLPPYDFNGQKGSQFGFKKEFLGNEVTGLINMNISGYIDKVTLVGNDLAVWEGKTTSESIDSRSNYWSRLELDPQIACYVWALSEIAGKPVNWVWYQVIRKPNPTTNAVFKRTHTVDGVDVSYTIEEYKKRLWKLLKEEPARPIIVRRKLYISEERKAEWVTEHGQSFMEIQARRAHQKQLDEKGIPPQYAWPRNHLGCDMYGGCLFWDVCIGKTTVEASGKFIKREFNGTKH